MIRDNITLYEKFLENLIKRCGVRGGDKILIGCSGGSDSIALLHLLYRASSEKNLWIFACHINYGLRGEASDRDEQIVKEECEKLGIEYEVFKLELDKIYQFSNLEEKLREYRYNIFRKQALKRSCNWIAIAHNKNDQAETLLLNLLRGSGTEGLSAMSYSGLGQKIIRPLLNIGKEEITMYIKENGIQYGEDESNYSMAFTRNKIRNMLIPLLIKEFNPSMIDVLYNTSLIIADEGTLLNEICQKYMGLLACKKDRSISIPINEFGCLPVAIRRRLLRLMFKYLTGHTRRLHFTHIETILREMNKTEGRSVIDLPDGIQVGIDNEAIRFYFKDFYDRIGYFEYKVSVPVKVKIEEAGVELELFIIKRDQFIGFGSGKDTLYVDYGKCKSELVIRNRREGDIFEALGAPGKKKLKDYLIDKKVPREVRDRLALVISEGNIVCIAGIEISEDYKITSKTKEILCVRILSNGR